LFPAPLVLALVVVDRVRDALQQLADRLERDVQLVAINGQPFYGTRNLMNATGAKQAERIAVGRLSRRVQLNPGFRDADMGWAQALADMEEARRDPVARYLEIEKFHKQGKKPPPWLKTDKPWDDPDVTGKPVPVTVKIRRSTRSSTTPPTSAPSSARRCTGTCSTGSAPTTSPADAPPARPGRSTMIEFDLGPPKGIAQHFAALPSDATHRDLYWYDWGPVFYRGRLDG